MAQLQLQGSLEQDVKGCMCMQGCACDGGLAAYAPHIGLQPQALPLGASWCLCLGNKPTLQRQCMTAF